MTRSSVQTMPHKPEGHALTPPVSTRLLILLILGIQLTFCWMARARSLEGAVDLRAFYSAGMMVRQGHADQLYDPAKVTLTQQQLFGNRGKTLPFLYPAFASLAFVPLSLFSYVGAFYFVLLANLALLYASARLLKVSLQSGISSPGWIFTLFLCFFPTSISLMQGQISCALLFVFVLAHVLAGRRQEFLAGLCLSLALAKPQLVLPVVLLYVLWGRWRTVCGFMVGGAGVLGISLLLTGLHGAKEYLLCLRGLGGAMMRDPASATLHFGMQTAAEPNLHGLVVTVAGAGTTSTVLVLAASFCTLAFVARKAPTVASALPAALLVSYHLQPYDLLLLLLPLASLRLKPRRQPASYVACASILLLTIPVAPYLLVHDKMVWLVLAVFGIAVTGALQHEDTTHHGDAAVRESSLDFRESRTCPA